jgi:hypothetical protein
LEAAVQAAFQHVYGKAAEFYGSLLWPVLFSEAFDGASKHSDSVAGGGGREGVGAVAAVVFAGDAVAGGRVPDGGAAEIEPADDTVAKLRHPAHEAAHPEAEVGGWHPDAIDLHFSQDGEGEAEDGVVDGTFGEFFEDFGDQFEGGGPGVVDRQGEGRGEDFEGVEPDELLLGAFDVGGANVGHGFECAAEAPSAARGVAGYSFDTALVAGEEADEEVGFVEGPGA